MTRIAFDARAILTDRPTGVERMLLRLFQHWPAGSAAPLAYLNRPTKYRFAGVTTRVFGPTQAAAWFHLGLPLHLQRDQINVFVSPVTQFPKLVPRSIRKVAIVYDLAYRRYPKLYTQSELTILNGRVADSIRSADHIITISTSTKRDLQEFYKIPGESISVCYPAADVPTKAEPLPSEYQSMSPYIFMIGTGYGRKNMEVIVPTLTELKQRHQLTPHVIMTGKLGFEEQSVMVAAEAAGVKSQITHLGYVDDQLRTSLMANASALFFPSFYEGFGLPILEAMELGCPVVCSSTSSLPEAGGDAAVYFDPTQANQAADQLARILTDAQFRDNRIQAGHSQAKQFSWDRMAKEFQQVLSTTH